MTVASHNQAPLAAPREERTDLLRMQELRQTEAEFMVEEPIYDIESIGLHPQDSVADISVVAEIVLQVDNPERGISSQDAHVAILRMKNRTDGRNIYVLQGLDVDEAGNAIANKHFVPVRSKGITLGRFADSGHAEGKHTPVSAEALWGKGFQYDEGVSREHITLTSFGPRLFMHETSTNGTRLKGKVFATESHVSEHTISASELARRRQLLNEQDEFAGRKVITRNTTVGPKGEATVDIRSWGAGAEAIVVDPDKDPQPYKELFDAFMKDLDSTRRWGPEGGLDEEAVLAAIHRAVSSSMEYDLPYVNEISEMMQKSGSDHRKINLAWYLDSKKGVCRQMALAAAWLGSEAAERGLLTGRMTAEVNQRVHDNAAHEWARYTAANGEVFIIDPAQRYFGRLANLSYRPDRWEYFRSGEKDAYMQKFSGNAVVSRVLGDSTQIDMQF
ncbi:MAG: hypothetical protein JWN82_523 [Candidatus Saccharibacteria bacterium]|nr:hypothetical protein [Candidatus Saccharibacteria bacterium]